MNQVKSERVRAGMNQDDLAEKMGVSRFTVGNWENGATVRSDHLIRMTEIFGCSADYLLGLSEERGVR